MHASTEAFVSVKRINSFVCVLANLKTTIAIRRCCIFSKTLVDDELVNKCITLIGKLDASQTQLLVLFKNVTLQVVFQK